MSEFDIEKVERTLWAEGFDYQITSSPDDEASYFEVYGDVHHVVLDGLYLDSFGDWIFAPETMFLHRDPGPVWRHRDGLAIEVDHLDTLSELCEAIKEVLDI